VPLDVVNGVSEVFREHIHQPVTKAGDVVIWSEATVHGATPWRGEQQRRIALYRFAPANMGYGRGYLEIPTEKLAQLKAIDEWHMKLLNQLFTDLKNVKEDGESLLDRTMVLYGSNLGNANTHVTTNLPTLFAGGGFRHGQHLAFDRDRNYPLPNLFVSMLQRMGIETDRFASATGTMRGLELA
jgi:hypothetical protein